jgi:exosortase/archaeosortase family protein
MRAMSSEGRQPASDRSLPRRAIAFLRRPERRFLITAVVLMCLLYGAYYYPYAADSGMNRAIEAYLRLQTWAAGALIGLFDPAVHVRDTLIEGRFPLQIVKSCSSLDAQALFVATVLAFPARAWTKALGLLAGVLALTALNLTRIAGLYFVGIHAPASFDSIHEEFLPLLLVAFACAAFALWARWARRAVGGVA